MAVAMAAIGWLLPRLTLASVPLDWASRLALATSVSHEGYADSSFAQRAQDSAISMANAVLAEIDIRSAEDSLAQAEVLLALGDYSFRKGAYFDAVSYWSRAEESIDPAISDVPLRLCLPVIAGHRDALDSVRASTSEALYTHLLKTCPSDSLLQLWTLAHLCENMWLMGEARFLHERVVATYLAHPDADGRWAIRSLVTLGEMTSKRIGIPHVTNPSMLQDSAIVLGQTALELARAQFGTTDTMFAYVADRLGDYYSRTGHRAAAYALWDSAWAANSLHLPAEHIEYQGNLDRMASVYRAQGRYLDAEALAKQALELRKKTRGEGHPEVAYMYENLGRTYHATGKYHEAEECYRAALQIREQAIERSNPLIAESYRQFGKLYFDDGRYALADRQFRRAMELMTDALGEQHSWVASCMRDLSTMYTTWGRPEESVEILKDALAIQRRFLGAAHPAIASTLEEIARTELLLGHGAEANLAINQAAEIDRASVAAGGIPQRSIRTTQARVFLATGSPGAAESLLTRSTTADGDRIANPQRTNELALLALAQAEQGRLDDAQTTYNWIFLQSPVLDGLSSSSIAHVCDQYARFLISRGEYSRAIEQSASALRTWLEILKEGGQVLSEHQALQCEQAMHRSRDILLSALIAANDDETHGQSDAFGLLLAGKGAISNSIFERERVLRHSEGADVAAIRDSLHFTRHRLATLYMKGLANSELPRIRETLDSLRVTKERLEQNLAQQLKHGTSTDNGDAHLTDSIRERLPLHATLVEYFHFKNAWLEDRDQYAALVVPAAGWPSLWQLGDAVVVDSTMRVYESQMAAVTRDGLPPSNDDQRAYHDIARALDSLIWAPFASHLPSDGTVFIAPDAELCLLSFAGLVNSRGNYLVEDRPIHYLSCGRSLLEDFSDEFGDGVLLVCDPDFDADARTRAQSDQEAVWIAAEPATIPNFVTLRSSCEYLSDRRFVRLPGTRDEVETVRRQLSSRNLGVMDLRSGAAASEEYLKHHAGKRRLLHLATHGFYLSRNCGKKFADHMDENDSALVGENPLLLSGICLAGANVSDDSAAVEDGILTAEEVASLPLDGTQWVVLSACETRLGETRHGEGVYGLQRAFQMAGANTVISALWSIPDRATTSFMSSLYASSGIPLYDAMRQSQLAAIAELRKRGQPDHPYNWGAFVAVGGWSPLD